jgi:hypothetical protein
MSRQMQHMHSRLEPAQTQQVSRDIHDHMCNLLVYGMSYDAFTSYDIMVVVSLLCNHELGTEQAILMSCYVCCR